MTTMKLFSRLTNSFVMTTAALVVVIGSLCFSVGEGLRLTPFPALSRTQESDTIIHAGTSASVSISKYGPLDVPVQKRGKRLCVDLAAASLARTKPAFNSIVHSFQYEADDLTFLPLIASHSGRAPPLHS